MDCYKVLERELRKNDNTLEFVYDISESLREGLNIDDKVTRADYEAMISAYRVELEKLTLAKIANQISREEKSEDFINPKKIIVLEKRVDNIGKKIINLLLALQDDIPRRIREIDKSGYE
jgi:hypothetical protein